MLSVSTVKSAGKAAGYYTAEDNYYFIGEQSTQWYGTGAESLGLDGPVDRGVFTAVLEGRLPDGSDLSRMQDGVNRHRPGYDLTFSAPKSVSVLALVTGDRFLIDAHQRAVSRTLDEVEKLATTRTLQDGQSVMEPTGNLLIARFTHDTSRNLEPHLHDHAVVANATLAEGGWKTLSSDITGKSGFTDVVWKQQVSLGAIYRGFLRQDVEAAGYPVTDTGDRGEWDITGVPVKPFSSRRQEILDAVGENATAKQKSTAALDTRQAKDFSNMEDVREHWQAVLAETGFDPDAFRQGVAENRDRQADGKTGPAVAPAPDKPAHPSGTSLSPSQPHVPEPGTARPDVQPTQPSPDRTPPHGPTAEPGAPQPSADKTSPTGPAPDVSRPEPQVAPQPQSQPPTDKAAELARPELAGAVSAALDRLSGKSVRFTYDDVMTAVLTHVPLEKGVFGQVRDALDAAIGRGQMLAVDKNQTLFTSAAHVRDEQRLSQVAAGLAGQRGGLLAPAGEKGVMAQVADANRAVTLIDVRGGTAFVNGLGHSVAALAARNDRPLVVVAADGAGLKRQNGVFRDVRGVQLMTAEAMKDALLPAQSLVYVTEAERFSTTALHDVLKAAGQQGAVTLVADTHARRATGFAAEVLKAAGVTTLSATPAGENVSVTMVQKETVEDRLTVAARYYAQEVAAGRPAVLQAGNERTRSQLTSRVREALAEEGTLGRVLGEVTVREPVWLDAGTRNDRSRYREGLVLERHDGNGQMTSFTITGVSEKLNRLTLSDGKGRTQGLNISDVDSHWRLFREKTLEVREGEQLRATTALDIRAPAGTVLTVTGMKTGRWLFRDRLVMQNDKGQTVKADLNTPLYAGYGYTEGFGTTRRASGSVIAVVAGKEVSDATVNMLKRSGESVIAFTPLSEQAIAQRLEENRPSVTVTQGVKAAAGEDSLTVALRALEARTMSHPERAVRLAVEKATGTAVTFSGVQVMANVITTDPRIGPDRASLELQRLQDRGDIIPLSAEQGAAGSFISRENLNNEVTILRHIAEGKNAVTPLLAHGLSVGQAATLTEGQRASADLILTSPDRITAIQGYAGTGKTTQFRTVAVALGALPEPPVIAGLAPTHRAVSELSAAGIPAQTIASFLSENSQWQTAGESRDFSRTLFVIDETSMNGNAQLAALLTTITEGGGRAVLSGDRDQLKSLESGAPFALALERSAADVAVMREIVRQTPALKPAVEAVIAGNVREAVRLAEAVTPELVPREPGAFAPDSSVVDGRALQKVTGSHSSPDLPGLIADDYAGRTAQARADTLIVAELNADREAINEAVHERLREKDDIGDDVTVPVLVRVNNSNADLGRAAFWGKQGGNTVKVGEQYFTVEETDLQSGIIRMQGLDGAADRWFSPAELRKESVAVFRPADRDISPGEKVRLTATDRERNLRASDMATVTGVTEDGQLTLETGDRTLLFDPKGAQADRHLDYGYAVTTYSAQGASVPYAIILAGVEGGRKVMAALDSTYVALSRAKEHVQVWVDDLSRWSDAVERNSGRRETVHDVMMRAEDVQAEREIRLWESSLPVAETRLSLKTDTGLTADARFQAGKSPEMLWPVINEHGRQRGNWHVPVSPVTGAVDFSNAHYEGATDGGRIVLQRGDRHGQVLEAADIQAAVAMMADNLHSPVVLRTDFSERPGEDPATGDAAQGEELSRREDAALASAAETALKEQEPEPHPDIAEAGDTAEPAKIAAEADRLADEAAPALALEDVLEHEREQDREPQAVQKAPERMSDEANIVRHDADTPGVHPDRQKTLD